MIFLPSDDFSYVMGDGLKCRCCGRFGVMSGDFVEWGGNYYYPTFPELFEESRRHKNSDVFK
jgi:hypothetical protein